MKHCPHKAWKVFFAVLRRRNKKFRASNQTYNLQVQNGRWLVVHLFRSFNVRSVDNASAADYDSLGLLRHCCQTLVTKQKSCRSLSLNNSKTLDVDKYRLSQWVMSILLLQYLPTLLFDFGAWYITCCDKTLDCLYCTSMAGRYLCRISK